MAWIGLSVGTQNVANTFWQTWEKF